MECNGLIQLGVCPRGIQPSFDEWQRPLVLCDEASCPHYQIIFTIIGRLWQRPGHGLQNIDGWKPPLIGQFSIKKDVCVMFWNLRI